MLEASLQVTISRLKSAMRWDLSLAIVFLEEVPMSGFYCSCRLWNVITGCEIKLSQPRFEEGLEGTVLPKRRLSVLMLQVDIPRGFVCGFVSNLSCSRSPVVSRLVQGFGLDTVRTSRILGPLP